MKTSIRILAAIFTLTMCLCLCACGAEDKPAELPAPTEAPAPAEESAAPVEEPVDDAVAEAPAEDLKAIAESYIEKEVSELFDAIGMPKESNYASSCIGEGEDGEHIYDGFTVYTYKEGESEIVKVVL